MRTQPGICAAGEVGHDVATAISVAFLATSRQSPMPSESASRERYFSPELGFGSKMLRYPQSSPGSLQQRARFWLKITHTEVQSTKLHNLSG